jgi:hypothetical protein
MKKLSDIFDIRYGHSLELNRLRLSDKQVGIPFVSRRMGENGISAYVERLSDIEPYPAGDLTCALSGNGVLTTFVQDRPYYTAFHVACLHPTTDLSKKTLLYYCTCIRANHYRYSWGRQANRTLGTLPVPSIEEVPDWVGNVNLEVYVGCQAPITLQAPPAINTHDWKPFTYDDLFVIERGRGPRIKDLDGQGTTPFITSTDSDNGLSGVTTQAACHTGNVISINRNGSVGEAFYQPVPFCSTEDVHIFVPRFPLNALVAMFLCTLIRREQYRFGYGRKWGIERMKKSVIRLPVDSSRQPDLQYMEKYIMSLPFSSQIRSDAQDRERLHPG